MRFGKNRAVSCHGNCPNASRFGNWWREWVVVIHRLAFVPDRLFGQIAFQDHDKDKGIQRNEQVHQDLKRLGWGKKAGGPWWDGHSALPEPFTNWTIPSAIAAVVKQRAKLKKLLTDEFVKLCTHFKGPLAKLAKAAASKQ